MLHFDAETLRAAAGSFPNFVEEWYVELPESSTLTEINLFNDNATDGTVLKK